ncbi:hypothetical protein [Actinokineospora fastidiosa]|uniref:hypothetical protein n=1 Tax=Actinokineospora fastidiosa TaxID=1816 RepID=UPI001670A4BE|nr:hypothetical protein [Actinokineospora fastidiosa]
MNNDDLWFAGIRWHQIQTSTLAIARGDVEHVIAVAAAGKMRYCRRNADGSTCWHLV